MFLKTTLFLVLTLTSIPARSQNRTVVREKSELATAELQVVVAESAKLDERLSIVSVRARAAAVLSYYDAVGSETMFRTLWRFVEQLEDSEKEQAKLLILKYASSRNPKLAREFLAAASANSSKAGAAPPDSSRLNTKLAANLIDVDPSMAATLLERSLINSPSPADLGALARLRDKDSILSDYVAAKVLDGLVSQPTLASLAALQSFAAYAFPGPSVSMASPEAQFSLESLQFRYFLTGYEVLRTSLAESDEALKRQHYTERDLAYRAANQGQIAAILAALAPRLQPTLAAELATVANKLSAQVPPNITQLTKIAVARLTGNAFSSEIPEERFAFALTNGDFDEARQQLERVTDETKRKVYSQLLNRNEARALLARSDFIPALTKIRELEDQTTRLVMYLEALKAIKKKHEPELLKIVINEAMLLIPQTDRNGLHVRALLSFAAQSANTDTADDAVEFLRGAVTGLNHLKTTDKQENEAQTMAEAAMAELNDPNSLMDAPEMEQAFISIGLLDLDRGLTEAKRIENRPVQLIARLQVLQGFSKSFSVGSKGQKAPKISSPPK
jgi:GH24 family phage-related lysozyme (muramidase)